MIKLFIAQNNSQKRLIENRIHVNATIAEYNKVGENKVNITFSLDHPRPNNTNGLGIHYKLRDYNVSNVLYEGNILIVNGQDSSTDTHIITVPDQMACLVEITEIIDPQDGVYKYTYTGSNYIGGSSVGFQLVLHDGFLEATVPENDVQVPRYSDVEITVTIQVNYSNGSKTYPIKTIPVGTNSTNNMIPITLPTVEGATVTSAEIFSAFTDPERDALTLYYVVGF